MNINKIYKYINILIVMSLQTTIPDDNNNINMRAFVLEPLTVIIKLAIISNKPVGTKIRIDNNVIYIQEPGLFQGICRYYFKTNKTDIHFLYNPIECACRKYLNTTAIQQNPKIKELFKCAQNGISKLIETYKSCSIITLCLNYYLSLISNYLDTPYVDTLFIKNDMTLLYDTCILEKFSKMWSPDKIKIVLNLTTFLLSDVSAQTNVKSLETIIDTIDKDIHSIIK
jgi:hypothetical protein